MLVASDGGTAVLHDGTPTFPSDGEAREGWLELHGDLAELPRCLRVPAKVPSRFTCMHGNSAARAWRCSRQVHHRQSYDML